MQSQHVNLDARLPWSLFWIISRLWLFGTMAVVNAVLTFQHGRLQLNWIVGVYSIIVAIKLYRRTTLPKKPSGGLPFYSGPMCCCWPEPGTWYLINYQSPLFNTSGVCPPADPPDQLKSLTPDVRPPLLERVSAGTHH